MTQSSIGGFFSGGAKGITWPENPPATVTGTIESVHPPEEILDPKDQKPTGKSQVRIVLNTSLRDPEIDDDDGRRTLYVKSWMRGAIGDALRKAGIKEPEVGAQLTVTFTHTEPPERPGLSASKHFTASYVPAANAAAGEFLTATGNDTPPAPVSPQRPASITEAAWAQMTPDVQAAVAKSMSGMVAASNEPPF